MNRRHFLSKVTQGTLALSVTEVFGRRAMAAAPRKLKHWIWVTGLEKETLEEQQRKLEQFREAGVHAALFNGHTPELLALAKKAGLETHAWIITLNRGDQPLLQNHPDWFVVNRLGDSSADKPPCISFPLRRAENHNGRLTVSTQEPLEDFHHRRRGPLPCALSLRERDGPQSSSEAPTPSRAATLFSP